METPIKPQKKRKLSKKQQGFVRDFVATGNGTQAALNNYDIDSKNPEKVASVIASENLTKPSIIEAVNSIADAIPDKLLAERHLELLNKREIHKIGYGEDVEYEMSDQPDTQAVSKALDMAYKLKKAYGNELELPPQKSGNVYNIIFASPEIQKNVKLLEDQIKAKLVRKTDVTTP